MSEEAVAASMTFREHLIELRARVFKATLAVFAGFFIAWNWHIELYAILTAPLRDAMSANNLFVIKALAITESIEVYMKLSLLGGLFIASPFVFYQIWAFIAPGLLGKEKRLILPVVVASVGCFALGALFCYLVALPFMADFLIRMTLEAPGLLLEPTIAGSVSFVLFLLVGFGVVFELPLFMYVMSALQMVTWRGFWSFYRYWIVIAFIIGAVLTPTPDPINQTIMSAPLVILYGVGVGVAWLVDNRGKPGAGKRALVPIAFVLSLIVIAALVVVFRQREQPAINYVPSDVQELVGLRLQAAEQMQSVADPQTSRLLAPIRLARAQGWQPADGQWLLVREGAESALLLDAQDAQKKLDALGTKLHATVSQNGPGRMLMFADTGANWQAMAIGKRTLWLGREGVIARLMAVKTGKTPALTADAAMAERLLALQGSGPVWALTAGEQGTAHWLPGGALAKHVKLGVALWNDKELTVKLECKGPEAAGSLRDRLETWLADIRQHDTQHDSAQARRMGRLAGMLAQAWQIQARNGGPAHPDTQQWSNLAREANGLAQEVNLSLGPTTTTDPLVLVVQPPTTSRVELEGAVVVWHLQVDVAKMLGVILAGSLPPAVNSATGSAAATAPAR
jgi:Tat protein translocase TatC